jgi:hypothetical protein
LLIILNDPLGTTHVLRKYSIRIVPGAIDFRLLTSKVLRDRPSSINVGAEKISAQPMQAAALQRNNAPLLLEPPQARRLLSRLPEIVTEFVAQVATATKVLAAEDAVEEAREATRQLLVDGQITLTPRMPTSAVASYYSECTTEPNSPRLRSRNGHTGAA